MNTLKLRQQLEQFFIEDLGDHDLTTLMFGKEQTGKLILMAKQDGVFCGEDVIRTGSEVLDEALRVEMYVKDGESVKRGQRLSEITGRVASLLQSERVILNIVQRMSGIATQTKAAVERLKSDHTRVCDTRKTTPGLRMLEKYAVQVGGGFNHRFGLYDGVMIKDNHIAFAGSITKAVDLIRERLGHMVKIEVETENAEQVKEAIQAKVDIIMFDNRSPEEIKEWIQWVPDHIVTEASGGITLDHIADYRDTGVDYISLGFLTHSVTALDISALVSMEQK